MKAKIAQIWANNPGRIFSVNEGSPQHRAASFAAIKPRTSGFKCDNCGHAVWNATNLHNDVHFCVNREIDITFSNFEIKTPTVK